MRNFIKGTGNMIMLAAFLTGMGIMLSVLFAASNPVVGLPITRSGVTDATGTYSFTFQNPYPSPPNVQASITNQASPNQSIRVTSVTASGYTINVYQRNVVTLLGAEVLLGAVVPVQGATVDVLVTAKE